MDIHLIVMVYVAQNVLQIVVTALILIAAHNV